jgi:hypothetical protein
MPVIAVPANLYGLEFMPDSDDNDVCCINLDDFEFPLGFNRMGVNIGLCKKSSVVIRTRQGTVAACPIVGAHQFAKKLIISTEFMEEAGLSPNEPVEVIGVMVDGLIDGFRLENVL